MATARTLVGAHRSLHPSRGVLQVYPTRVRSFAFGIFNALSRLGGLIAPFVGVDLFENVCSCPALCHVVLRKMPSVMSPQHDCDKHAQSRAGNVYDCISVLCVAQQHVADPSWHANGHTIVQKGVRPAVGLFLGAAALAAVLSLLLPIETRGRELAEDAAELELQRLEEKASTASSTLKPPAHTYSANINLAPHSTQSAPSENPFHTEDLTESVALDDSGAGRGQLERV